MTHLEIVRKAAEDISRRKLWGDGGCDEIKKILLANFPDETKRSEELQEITDELLPKCMILEAKLEQYQREHEAWEWLREHSNYQLKSYRPYTRDMWCVVNIILDTIADNYDNPVDAVLAAKEKVE
jgi:hypothetical protein